jgi:5-methylcytosine-specific restriction protein A
MAYRALRLCAAPGCGAASAGRYCQKHSGWNRPDRIADRERGSHSKRGYGRRWERLRKLVLARDPLCRIGNLCGGMGISTEADHIVPRARGGDDSMENLQGACHACHSHKTATEDSAFAYGPG